MKRNKNTSYFKRFISLTLRFILVIIIVLLPIITLSFFFRIKEVEVIGTDLYAKDEILEYLVETEADKSSIFLYLKYKYFKKSSIPFVDKVEIELININKINIYVYDKVITGAIEYMGEYMYFDRDGVIVESANDLYNDVPLIKGLYYNKIILNQKLEVAKDELFDIILNITNQIQYNKVNVEIIEFNCQFEVKLYCGDNIVLLGKEDTYDEKLAELSGILKEGEIQNLTINMRNIQDIRGKENFSN